MLNAATARALADVAARAGDVLHAYDPGYTARFGDAAVRDRIVPDGDPLAVAAPDGDYFIVAGSTGERRYSRDGRMFFADGRLQNAQGDVLGFPSGARSGELPQPLRADSVDAALGRPIDVRVEAGGTVAYSRTTIDPRTMLRGTQRVVIGTVALARFPAGTNPLRAAVAPYVGVPGEDGFGTLATRSRGLGSVDINLGLAKLQEAYLAFDALQAAQRARSELDKGAMDLVK